MENRVECILGSDLLPWERSYFETLLHALESRVRLAITHYDLKAPRRMLTLSARSPVWIITRDWRKLIKAVGRRHPAPVFVSALGSKPSERLLGFIRGSWNPRPRLDVRILAHSPFAYRFFRELEGLPVDRILQQPLPGFLANETAHEPGQALRVGYLAPPGADANLNFLVTVAHYVSRTDSRFRFLVHLTEGQWEHLSCMAKDMGLEGVFEPVSTHWDMDVLIHTPLKSDHFIPILWMGARGVAVLATDVPGIEDLVSDGHDGFVVPVNEAKPLGELLVRLAQDSTLRQSLGAKLRQGLAKRFPLDRVMSQYQSLFLASNPAAAKEAAA